MGAEPQGQLQWVYYKDIPGPAYSISDLAVTESLQTVRECSHMLMSTLTMLVTEKLNNILIRCTLQQDTLTADGDEHRQTDRFNITCMYTKYVSQYVYSEREREREIEREREKTCPCT